MAFEPVALVAPDGRPWPATSAREVINLINSGYRYAPEPSAKVPAVPAESAPGTVRFVDSDLPPAA